MSQLLASGGQTIWEQPLKAKKNGQQTNSGDKVEYAKKKKVKEKRKMKQDKQKTSSYIIEITQLYK